MKRNVLRFFSLLLILLVFFTLISPKVEEEMATLVDARQRSGKGNSNLNISYMAVTWPDQDPTLFSVTEGSGWESGLHVGQINYFEWGQGYILLGPGTDYWYIMSASRLPVLGDNVTPVESWKGEDAYLLWHPESVDDLHYMTSSMELLAQSDNAALISNWSSTFPFFEHYFWYLFRNELGDDVRVYSLHDIRQFVEALPWLTAVLMVLVCSLILWFRLWKPGRSRGFLVMSILLAAAMMAALPWILGQFNLPASLMPPVFILDLKHYAGEFGRITSAMNSLGDDTVKIWLMKASAISSGVAVPGVFLTVALPNLVKKRKK